MLQGDGLAPGCITYDPEEHNSGWLRSRDESERILPHLVQQDLAKTRRRLFSSPLFFGRSTFKYGDRRVCLFCSSRSPAQNANLTAAEMGLITTNVCGYSDRGIDRYLGIDGLMNPRFIC